MRKILITLVALSGISMGETLAKIDTAEADLKAYWNFDSSSSLSSGTMQGSSWANLPTWNASGYGQMTTTETHLYTTTAGLSASTGFTVSFDINGASVGTLLSVGTQRGLDQPWRSCSITLADGSSEGTSLISAQFLGNSTDAVSQEMTLAAGGWTTLTLVAEGDAANNLTLTFYINGTLIGSSTTSSAANFVSETANKLAFGYYSNNEIADGGSVTNIDNILVYSRALTASEVKNLTIPEPATATLSLLALVGLATRRRRK